MVNQDSEEEKVQSVFDFPKGQQEEHLVGDHDLEKLGNLESPNDYKKENVKVIQKKSASKNVDVKKIRIRSTPNEI